MKKFGTPTKKATLRQEMNLRREKLKN